MPQHRERLFLVCFRHDLAAAADAFRWPRFPAARAEQRATLHSMLEAENGEAWRRRYQLTPSQWAVVRASKDYATDPVPRTP